MGKEEDGGLETTRSNIEDQAMVNFECGESKEGQKNLVAGIIARSERRELRVIDGGILQESRSKRWRN